MIKVSEHINRNSKGCSAKVVEEKKTIMMTAKTDLIAYNFNIGVRKKTISILPYKTTYCAAFEICHSQSLKIICQIVDF
jgi:hypothetical protein